MDNTANFTDSFHVFTDYFVNNPTNNMSKNRIFHRKILLVSLLIIASRIVAADDSSLRRESSNPKTLPKLSFENIFKRNVKVSQPINRWKSLAPLNFIKGKREDKGNRFIIKSEHRTLTTKVNQLQANMFKSIDDLKRGLKESVDTTCRPWTMERRLHRPNSSLSWTTSLVWANVIVYGLQMFFPSITRVGTKRSDLILRGKELHRLFTPVFLHGTFIILTTLFHVRCTIYEV